MMIIILLYTIASLILIYREHQRNIHQSESGNVRPLYVIAILFFALLLYGTAGLLVNSGWIRDSRAYYALVVLTPAVFFSSILASFRGYFQGYQMMTPPAVSQILEQLVRVTVMIGLAYFLLPRGLEYAAAGAAFGAVPGGLKADSNGCGERGLYRQTSGTAGHSRFLCQPADTGYQQH